MFALQDVQTLLPIFMNTHNRSTKIIIKLMSVWEYNQFVSVLYAGRPAYKFCQVECLLPLKLEGNEGATKESVGEALTGEGGLHLQRERPRWRGISVWRELGQLQSTHGPAMSVPHASRR